LAPRGWLVDQPSGGGRIAGRHCGPKVGLWVMDGTYDRQGQKGQQHWDITVFALASLDGDGDFSYIDHATMTVAGVTVTLDGQAKGVIRLTFDSTGRAMMHFTETFHSYVATVPGGGRGQDQNAPLAEFDLAWEVDPTCP